MGKFTLKLLAVALLTIGVAGTASATSWRYFNDRRDLAFDRDSFKNNHDGTVSAWTIMPPLETFSRVEIHMTFDCHGGTVWDTIKLWRDGERKPTVHNDIHEVQTIEADTPFGAMASVLCLKAHADKGGK